MVEIRCPKCAGPVQSDSETRFTKCDYCSSQIYIDRSGAGLYYVIPFKLSESDALGTFRGWAGGSIMAKDLDQSAQVGKVTKKYFPMYIFRRNVNGKEEVMLEPAGSTTLPGLHGLKLPGDELQIFDARFDVGGAEMIQPDIAMTHYLTALPGMAKEQSLVFFPIWQIDYQFQEKEYLVIVDASSSEVFASSFPTRNSKTYLAVSPAGFVAFVGGGLLATVDMVAGLALMGAAVVGTFASSFYVARRL